MSPIEADFVSRHKTAKYIVNAFGTKSPAAYTGKVQIEVETEDGPRKITFDNSLHSSHVIARLLSVPAMDEKGLVTVMGAGRVSVFRKDGKLVMTGTLIEKQYYLDDYVDNDVLSPLSSLFKTLFR